MGFCQSDRKVIKATGNSGGGGEMLGIFIVISFKYIFEVCGIITEQG